MLDRLAFTCLCLLAVSLGVGDIAQVTPFDTAVLNGVHGLLLLVIGLTLVAHIARGQRPAFPSSLALPMAAWLCVLLASAALAAGHRADALASLERPAGGALLAWAVVALCRTETRWVRLSSAIALGGLAIALVGLAEASGAPALSGWLALLRDGPIPIGDVPRIASTLSHPNEAAMLLELTLPLLVAWAWSASQPWRGLMPAAAFGT
jgi:hypothetical protein